MTIHVLPAPASDRQTVTVALTQCTIYSQQVHGVYFPVLCPKIYMPQKYVQNVCECSHMKFRGRKKFKVPLVM
jgi:hypothetical protein